MLAASLPIHPSDGKSAKRNQQGINPLLCAYFRQSIHWQQTCTRGVSVRSWSVPVCVRASRLEFIFEFRHATVSRMIYSTFFKPWLICVNNRRRGIAEWHHFRRRLAQVKRSSFTSRRQRHAGRFISRFDRSYTLLSFDMRE